MHGCAHRRWIVEVGDLDPLVRSLRPREHLGTLGQWYEFLDGTARFEADLHAVSHPGHHSVERRDPVVGIHLGAPASHNARYFGVRTNDRQGPKASTVQREDTAL